MSYDEARWDRSCREQYHNISGATLFFYEIHSDCDNDDGSDKITKR